MTAATARSPKPEILAELAPPSHWLLAMEFRAFWEFGAVLPAWPRSTNA